MIIVPHETHFSVHATPFRPWFDHAALPIPPLWQRISAGARMRATLSLTSLRWSEGPSPCPVRWFFPRNSGPSASGSLGLAGSKPFRPAARPVRGSAPNRRDRRSRSAPGPPMPHRHARTFFSRRRTIFCTGPMTGICVVPPPPAPAPPRRIAMRCSRCRTKTILARFPTPWKIEAKPLALLKKSRTLVGLFPRAGRLR